MLHLHNCIYFADLGILKENRKEDAVQFLSFTSQKAMSPCAEEKKTNQIKIMSNLKIQTSLKLLTICILLI